MSGNNNNNVSKRISELEQLTEALFKSQKHLLTAQILIDGRQDALEKIVTTLATKVDSFIDAQKEERDLTRERMKHLDDRVDKLVSAIGELIQKLPVK